MAEDITSDCHTDGNTANAIKIPNPKPVVR